jgi:hypothetical protein
MEINYGDAHFRRSDGGQTLYNPFIENYIVDAFTTEIGGEIYLQKNGLFGMVGLTNGMIKGNVDSVDAAKVNGQIVDDNTARNPSIYLKTGYDKQLTKSLRVRVSGSFYHNSSSAASGLTLYGGVGGDRTGSNYQNVMERVGPAGTALPAATAIAWSGRVGPNFSKKVDAYMINGFVKAGGLEFFGTYERAEGRTKFETDNRKMTQLAGDVLYRFGREENLFLGARYNTVKLGLAGITEEVNINRFALAGGWFVSKNILMKGEYVIQKYNDFPTKDFRHSGKFNGYVIEAVVGF